MSASCRNLGELQGAACTPGSSPAKWLLSSGEALSSWQDSELEQFCFHAVGVFSGCFAA